MGGKNGKEKHPKNQLTCFEEHKQEHIFPVVENHQNDLKEILKRLKKNPGTAKELLEAIKTDPGIPQDRLEVAKIKQEDREKGRNPNRKRESAYHPIPLDDISVDLKNFQNRRMPYSEYSVQGIIDAIRSGTFKKALFAPCILWKSPKGKNFVLAGHSRNEAFRRLREMVKTDPQIQQWCHKHEYSFDALPCLYISDINFDDAKTIALMSNALATAEMDVERANVYRCMAEIGKTHQEIETFGKKCEKSNRYRIRAYSYLAENGMATDALYRFDTGNEQNYILKRLSYRLGELRRKNPEISDIHENELFDRLLNKGVYGKNRNKGEINKMDVFIDVVERHIEQLKTHNEFAPDKILNINKIKDLSYTMKYYYETLETYRSKKKVIMEDFHALRRKISQLKATTNITEEKRSILDKLEEQLQVSFKAIGNCEDIRTATDMLFDATEVCLDPDEEIALCQKKQKALLNAMMTVEKEYYAFRYKKDSFQEASKSIIKMEFTP